jgi:hypothetical protein
VYERSISVGLSQSKNLFSFRFVIDRIHLVFDQIFVVRPLFVCFFKTTET